MLFQRRRGEGSLRRDSENLRWAKYLMYFCAGVTFLYVSYLGIFYIILDFDGALHSQAAINFYKMGRFIHDYKAHLILAIGFPFQLVAGLLYKIFGVHFTTTGLTNVLFYALFFWFFYQIGKKSASKLPLLAFIVCSFSLGLLRYGFSGYGELPALILGVAGVYVLLFHRGRQRSLFGGALLIALAVSLKWVTLLLLAPLFLVSLLLLRKKEIKPVVLGLLYFGVTLLIMQGYYFWSLGSFSFGEVAHKLLNYHNSSLASQAGFLSKLMERMAIFSQVYVQNSGTFGSWLAPLKLLVYAWMLFVSIKVFFKIYHRFPKGKNRGEIVGEIDNLDLLILFICFYAVGYFAWWVLLQTITQPWYRRVFNADLLLFCGLGLLPYLYQKYFAKYYRGVKYVVLAGLLIFTATNLYDHFYQKKGLDKWLINNIELEAGFREGLERLPEKYQGYGLGWYSAPRWSFVAQKKFQDLNAWEYSYSSLFYDSLVQKRSNYVFYEGVTPRSYTAEIRNIYDVEKIYNFRGCGIFLLKGFNLETPTYVETIDFTKEAYEESVRGFNNWNESLYRCSRFDSAVFLDNSRNYQWINLSLNNSALGRNKSLRVRLVAQDGPQEFAAEFPISQGQNSIYLKVPDGFRGIKFGLYLLLAPYQDRASIERGLKFTRITLTDQSGKGVVTKGSVLSKNHQGTTFDVILNSANAIPRVITFGKEMFMSQLIHGFYQDKWVSNEAVLLLKSEADDQYLILEGSIPKLSYRKKTNRIEIWYQDPQGGEKLLVENTLRQAGDFTIKSPRLPKELAGRDLLIMIKSNEFIKPLTSPDTRALSFHFKSLYFSKR